MNTIVPSNDGSMNNTPAKFCLLANLDKNSFISHDNNVIYDNIILKKGEIIKC